jgi:hypothetical protein
VIPVDEYVRREFVPLSHLAHGWELHSAVPLTPAEERSMVREPAQAVPASIAERLGKVRVLVVPYVVCLPEGDAISFSKPKSEETHSTLWLAAEERSNLVLASRELDAHDTGFEFLASVAGMLLPKLSRQELQRYTEVVEEEVRLGIRGEIDEDALAARKPFAVSPRAWRRHRMQFERYRDVSFCSTAAEYMHGLWHDVQIRIGPDHLPIPQLRRRMSLMAEMFPPNPGYSVFAEELEKKE